MSESVFHLARITTSPERDGSSSTPVRGRPAAKLREYTFDRVTRLGRGSGKPVFAVVHSNGAFFPLGQKLGASHRFVALQAADRRSGGRLPNTVEEIASRYVQQLLGEEPQGPYILLGWCHAGVIAYEAALQLQAAGHEVAGLVVVDTWNPAYSAAMSPLRRKLTERSYGLQVILSDFTRVARGELSLHTCLRQRNMAQRLLGPMKTAPALSGAAAESYRATKAFDEELSRQLAAATAVYRPRRFAGRTLHVRSSTEPCGFGLDRRFGWSGLIDAEYVTLQGDHYTIFLEPTVEELGRCVARLAGVEDASL